eukprot:1980521-Prymnesium_polylepis.1
MRTRPGQKQSQRLLFVFKVVVHDARNRKIPKIAPEMLRVVVGGVGGFTPLIVAFGTRGAAR